MMTLCRAACALAVSVVLMRPAVASPPPPSPPLWAHVVSAPPLPDPDRRGFVATNGARIYYAVFHLGGGAPVILLHGGFASSNTWGFEVPLLAARHEVIVLDTRGHGRSTMPAGPLSYETMASDVVAVMDTLHVRQASIVGVSDGGIVGLILAIRHPDRVARLFAWGANFNTHSDSTAPPDPAMKDNGRVYITKMQAEYRRLSPTPDGFRALAKKLDDLYAREPNLSPAELGRIKAPTVIADGAHEQFIARAHTEALAQLISGARLVILPGVSHGGPQQDPAGFHAAVAALLDRTMGAGR